MTSSIDPVSDNSIQPVRGDRTLPISNTASSPDRCNNIIHKSTSTPPPQTNNRNKNAFAVIMGGSSKKCKRNQIVGSGNTKSRFIPCPVCGNHIVPHEMNKHLDECLLQQGKKNRLLEAEKKKLATPMHSSDMQNIFESEESSSYIAKPVITEETGTPSESVPAPTPALATNIFSQAGKVDEANPIISEDQQGEDNDPEGATPTATATISTDTNSRQNNVFAHMMKRSMNVFSENKAPMSSPKLFQHMHLCTNGTVTLTCHENKNIVPAQDEIAWSATVQVRGKKETATPAIELLISSSIASFGSNFSPGQIQPERQRLVRNHSRISVPVLKSILQKSIRRRKPLPSVRVASELADKSLGDLLRRLPIIILEDSTLHPSFPFLVWLMMAISKDYLLPPSLLKRVLGIVFETASCRWQDSLRPHKQQRTHVNNDSSINIPGELTLASLHNSKIRCKTSHDNGLSKQMGISVALSKDELIVWSILMRGKYGGMACDIQMLQCYAELWQQRLCSIRSLSDDAKKLLSPSVPSPTICNSTHSTNPAVAAICTVTGQKSNYVDIVPREWNQVPAFVHEPASKHSAGRIDRLMMSQKITQSNNNEINNHHFVGLSCLSKSDITLEGVDFHCSSILDSVILCNPKLVQECCDQLEAIGLNCNHHRPAASNDQCIGSRRSWLERVLKSCMWKYSAGVNLRLYFDTTDAITSGINEHSDLKEFYEASIKPKTKIFSTRYIDERLCKRVQGSKILR